MGLEYCDVNWLFLGLKLDWLEGPLFMLPARNWGERRHPLPQDPGGQARQWILASSLKSLIIMHSVPQP